MLLTMSSKRFYECQYQNQKYTRTQKMLGQAVVTRILHIT